LTILSSARKIILVYPDRTTELAVSRLAEVDRVFEGRKLQFADYLVPLRPRHWLKNLLAFAPVFAAHQFYEISLLERSFVAFAGLCCCASSGYLFNDLFDLSADRRHPRKRFRLFAAGDLPLSYALVMIPILVIFGCLLGLFVSPLLGGMLLAYFILTLCYSLYIKRVVLLDVIVLAALYTLRIIIGSAAVGIWPSPWLLAFSIFLFLSLALVKRYSELVVMRKVDGDAAKARSYELGDAELLAAKGTASGYLAVFVLALYITSGPADTLYGRHEFIWFLCPLLLYWIGRMWLMAHRGRMNDDPVVFTMSDWTSRILILLMLGTAIAAL
jgi:4-hydroxybenzoate polyprenyltransferase